MAPLYGGKVQKRLLNIRRKVQQVHDLRHARLRDLTESGELGEIRDDALAEEPVVLDRQGQ
jgi:hypothetical protein